MIKLVKVFPEHRVKFTKRVAEMEIHKKTGIGKVQFKYVLDFGYILIIPTKTTKKRIQKFYEVAKKLDAYLIDSRTIITEEKYKKLMERYTRKK